MLRIAVVSFIAGLISGELVFWALLLGYLILNRSLHFISGDEAIIRNYSANGETKVGRKGWFSKAKRKAARALTPFLRAVER